MFIAILAATFALASKAIELEAELDQRWSSGLTSSYGPSSYD